MAETARKMSGGGVGALTDWWPLPSWPSHLQVRSRKTSKEDSRCRRFCCVVSCCHCRAVDENSFGCCFYSGGGEGVQTAPERSARLGLQATSAQFRMRWVFERVFKDQKCELRADFWHHCSQRTQNFSLLPRSYTFNRLITRQSVTNCNTLTKCLAHLLSGGKTNTETGLSWHLST